MAKKPAEPFVPILQRPTPHPSEAYLTRLSPGSRDTMRGALDTIAGLLTAGARADTFAWQTLRLEHTQAVRTALAERYAPATANRMLAALRGVLQEAWRLGLMSRDDQARAADLAKVRGERVVRGRALSTQEIQALLDACDSSPAGLRDRALLWILYGCGLRRAELAAIDVKDLERDGGLRVHGKGNKERRVYLRAEAVQAIEAWLECRGRAPGALFWALDRGHHGARLTDDGVFAVLARLARTAKVESFTPNDLRRTFISELLDSGEHVSTIQALAGHASMETTAMYDRRDMEVRKRRAVNKLPAPF
jgi:integrase/recombinase XerD